MSASISARLSAGQRLDLHVEVAQAHVRVDAGLLQRGRVLLEDVLEEDGDGVAEHDGVGDLHHGGLEVQGEQHAAGLGVVDLVRVELAERLHAHPGGVDDLAGQQAGLLLEDRHLARRVDELDAVVGGLLDDGGVLVGVEVTLGHVGDVGLGVRLPGAELVRVLLREVLHRRRRAAVRVALAEHRVDGAAQALRVARLERLLGVVLRDLRVLRHVVAVLPELGDGLLELRNGGRDVGQLDDVGVGRLCQLAELGQVVRHALLRLQLLREVGEDAPGHRDVARLDLDAGALHEGLDDGEERVGRQRGRLVNLRPDDLRRLGRHAISLVWSFVPGPLIPLLGRLRVPLGEACMGSSASGRLTSTPVPPGSRSWSPAKHQVSHGLSRRNPGLVDRPGRENHRGAGPLRPHRGHPPRAQVAA